MRIIKVLVLILSGLLLALWLLGLLVGVWLPDVMFAPRRTIASASLTNGYNFRVIQYWNRVDFYSTELHVTGPDGRPEVHTLDGDDNKSWSVPISVDEQRRVVSVTLGGGRVKTVKY